jgi:flavin reductase (DIM6/NTAB) family NADH-FMN oxidoreductase RutF
LSTDPQHMRHVLGHVPTGVTVVTGTSGDSPLGISCNSFTSVSLDPPLIAFCVAHGSWTWERIRETGRFAINVLADGQEHVCRRFASKERDRFAGIPWQASASGSPLLDGTLAWIDCELEQELEAGDHLLVLGRVLDLHRETERQPLVFFCGDYGSVRLPIAVPTQGAPTA